MARKLIERQTIYEGKKVTLEVHRIEDEAAGRKYSREVVKHPGAVVILPITEEGDVLMIRNYRYAVDDVLLELPAGTLEKGEPPINCAGRELLEECGYLAKRLEPIASFYSSPGILSEKMYAFLATSLEKKVQALEEGEEIEVVPMRFDEVVRLAKVGEIKDAKTIATVLMYAAQQGFGI